MPHKVHKKSRLHENIFKPRFSPTLVFPDPTPESSAAPLPATSKTGVNTVGVPSNVGSSATSATPTNVAVAPSTATPVTSSSVQTVLAQNTNTGTTVLSTSTSTSLSSPSTVLTTSSTSVVVVGVATTPSLTSATPINTATRAVAGISLTPSSSIGLNFTPTSIAPVQPTTTNATTNSGLSTGGIVGLAAAGVAGFAVLGAAGFWLFKKYSAHKDDADEPTFTRHSWMRNSVAIPDDSPTTGGAGAGVGSAAGFGAAAAGVAASRGGPDTRPRPPTMIERHQANVAAMRTFSPGPAYPDANTMPGYGYSAAAGAGAGYGAYGAAAAYGAADGYDSYDAQAPMRSISPGQHYPGPSPASPQPYFNPIASPPPIGHSPAPSDHTGNGPVYFSRHDSQNQPMVVPGHEASNSYADHPYASPGQQYANMERSSPYPSQTYQAQAVNAASPFADPIMPAAPVPAAIPAPISLARAVAAQERGSPSPPLSPARTAQVVHVPDADMHAGRETPVQFGYSEPAAPAPAVTAPVPATTSRAAKRTSVASKKSVAGRPETMYDDEDAYAGI